MKAGTHLVKESDPDFAIDISEYRRHRYVAGSVPGTLLALCGKDVFRIVAGSKQRIPVCTKCEKIKSEKK